MSERQPDFVDECYADKDLSMLQKLTLVIPTYNRNYYLSRCLWYHAHFPFGQIIVADSSPEEKKVVNRETVEKIRSFFFANIVYLEYQPETEYYGGDIYRKWADAITHVETPYSQFCTDKEFLIPTALIRCMSFLDEHRDYVTAEGVVYQLRGSENSGYDLTPWQKVPSVTAETETERLKTAWERVTGALFSVYRTEEHQLIYQNLLDFNIDDIRYGETAIEIQPLVMGMIQKFHDLNGRVRDISHLKTESLVSNINTKESSFTRYPRIQDYPKDLGWRLLGNLQRCCSSLSVDSKISSEVISEIIAKIFQYRYNSGVGLYDKVKIVRVLWNKIPLTFQRRFKRLIGFGDTQFTAEELGSEIVLITNIIRDTEDWHQNDEPIPVYH